MYFHTHDPRTISFLANVLLTAEETGTRVRIDVDRDGNLKIKRGEGMWSPAFINTDDPYRDASTRPRQVNVNRVDSTLKRYADEIQSIIDADTSGDHTWIGVLSRFLTEVTDA